MATERICESASSSLGTRFIRCGVQANLYFVDSPTHRLTRGQEIIVRTERGLEMAEVLGEIVPRDRERFTAAKYVRLSRPEDQLLWKQLIALSSQASDECQRFLNQNCIDDVLVEVEPLLDGRTIYFYFLGQPTAPTESFVQQLAQVYQQEVAKSKFANLLEKGCGPGCGTKDKAVCGSGGGCAVCALASACRSK